VTSGGRKRRTDGKKLTRGRNGTAFLGKPGREKNGNASGEGTAKGVNIPNHGDSIREKHNEKSSGGAEADDYTRALLPWLEKRRKAK